MANFTGGPGPDILVGTDNDDTIYGYGGNDVLTDGGGNDKVFGGNGNDTIHNLGGTDLFNGGSGRDKLVTDISDTGRFTPQSFQVIFDTVAGVHGQRATTAGRDTLKGIEDFTLLGDFDVFVTTGDEKNVIRTDLGNDRINVGGGNDKVFAGGGNDRIFGGDGDDQLYGGRGRDYIEAGGGDDKVFGGAGNDTLVMTGSGAQSFDGGSGVDTFKSATGDFGLDASLVIGVNLKTGEAGLVGGHANNDTVSRIENVVWSGYNNMELVGNGGDNTLASGSGNDLLRGNGGRDTLLGNNGRDRLFGNNGADMLKAGKGQDKLVGGRGQDEMYAGNDAATDTFVFKDGDTAKGKALADRVHQFDSGTDKLDLTGIDADSATGGNQSLSFSAGGAAAHSVWVEQIGSNAWVNGDVDGDGATDFRIKMVDLTGLDAADVLL